MVFHPEPWIDRDWRSQTRLPVEDVRFSAEDGTRLFGWYLQATPDAPVLLWCHGNAGNLIHRLDNMAALYRVGLSLFIFDYRGYGLSEGHPSEAGFYQDALAAYQYVTDTRRVTAERLVLFGRSVGAAVAGDVAAKRPAAGLILEGAFPSIEAVVKHYYYGLPLHWLISSRFPLVDKLKQVRMPVLVIHGEQDDIIPVELGRSVFNAAPAPKSLYLVPGAGHNDCYVVGASAYFSRLNQFIRTSTS
jgi:fermentation-respiration switch protein FrsA (DUF1100 family)